LPSQLWQDDGVPDPHARSSPAPTDTRPLWRDVAFLIIVVTGLFHIGRGATWDGVIFLGVAALLVGRAVADRGRTPDTVWPVPVTWAGNAARAVLVGLACLLYGWVIGQWSAPSTPLAVAIALPGLVVLALALRVGRALRAPVRPGWWSWALVGVLICVWELVAFLQQASPDQGSFDHPTLSVILDPVFAAPLPRVLLLAGWLAAGVMLARLLLAGRSSGTSNE
jgi:hypothetical protein